MANIALATKKLGSLSLSRETGTNATELRGRRTTC